MKNVPLFPRPASWLGAVLLYLFLGLWIMLVASVLPRLFELGATSPRLAALGYLGLWTSPVAFVAVAHHIVHAFLDRADDGRPGTKVARGVLPGLGSVWAGVFGWLVMMFTSSVCILCLLILFPPPPPDALFADAVQQILTSFTWPLDARARAGFHTVAWVVLAAQLYDLERAVKERAARGDV